MISSARCSAPQAEKTKPNRDALSVSQTGKYYRNNNINNNAGSWKGFAEEMLPGEKQKSLQSTWKIFQLEVPTLKVNTADTPLLSARQLS